VSEKEEQTTSQKTGKTCEAESEGKKFLKIVIINFLLLKYHFFLFFYFYVQIIKMLEVFHAGN